MDKIDNIISEIKWFFKRIWYVIKNIIKLIPILWNNYDWDYNSIINLFVFQLKNVSKHLQSDNTNTLNANLYGKKIDLAITLIDKIYGLNMDSELFCLEYQDKLTEKYGEYTYDFKKIENSEYYEMVNVFERDLSEEELKQFEIDNDKWFKESLEKEKKAKRILWNFINHNIEKWWD